MDEMNGTRNGQRLQLLFPPITIYMVMISVQFRSF
jgi:hypothetical protein